MLDGRELFLKLVVLLLLEPVLKVAIVVGGCNLFHGDTWVTATGMDRSTAYQIGSSNRNSGAKHEAGYDAFMTGCIFAQACNHLDIDFRLSFNVDERREVSKVCRSFLSQL